LHDQQANPASPPPAQEPGQSADTDPDSKPDQALQEQVQTLNDELAAARQTIDALERRQRIDALLADQEAVDLEAARLLTEVAVAEMPDADLASAVAELKRDRPYLFRSPTRGMHAGVMAPRSEPEPTAPLQAAEQAARSGDRRDLLRYLRLRRQRE